MAKFDRKFSILKPTLNYTLSIAHSLCQLAAGVPFIESPLGYITPNSGLHDSGLPGFSGIESKASLQAIQTSEINGGSLSKTYVWEF